MVEPIGQKRIKSMHIYCSVYDSGVFQGTPMRKPFPNATWSVHMHIAHNYDTSAMVVAADFLPKLEGISLQYGTVNWNYILNYCKLAKQLKTIILENCLLDHRFIRMDIIEMADVVQSIIFPLRLVFDRSKTQAPISVFRVEKELLYTEIEKVKYDRQIHPIPPYQSPAPSLIALHCAPN